MRYLLVAIMGVVALMVPSVFALQDTPENSPQQSIQFTERELAWIENNRNVTVIGDAAWLPYEGFDSNGRYVGIVAEVLNLISQKSGLIFDVKETPSWRHSLQFSEGKQVDIISASASNPIIEKNYVATHTTITSPIVMVAHNDMRYISDLSAAEGLRVALIGTAGYNKQIIESYPNINFTNIDEIDEGLLGVAEDHYDLVLMSMMVASYQMAELGLYELRVAGITDLEMELTLFVNRNKPILWGIIDKLKRNESKQEMHKILSKWAKESTVEHYSPQMVRLFIVVALLLLFLAYRHFLLTKQAKRLKALIQMDSLSNVHKRLYWEKLFTEKVNDADETQQALSLIMVDIDNMRSVNEKHGYLTGDKLLQQFSLLIKDNIASSDFIGRWSGDQFVILCINVDLGNAFGIAERLRVEIEQTIFLGVGKKTASFGVSQCQPQESAENFLGRADSALYGAKETGRNKTQRG